MVADIEKIRGVDNGTDGKRNWAYGLLRILMVCLTKLSGVKWEERRTKQDGTKSP